MKYRYQLLLKLSIFFIFFTFFFYVFRAFHIQPDTATASSIVNIPWLFSAIAVIFSIISGFIIQSKWQTWNELIDATHGEITALKQLHMLANHFTISIQKAIRKDIDHYLTCIIQETAGSNFAGTRSDEVEKAIYTLEETVLDINYSEHPSIGSLAFTLVHNCLDYREKRLQNLSHQLPPGVRFYLISATFAIIISSLMITISATFYDYVLTFFISLLSYGIYLLIDDLDHPYRPGHWQVTKDEYIVLHDEVSRSLKNPELLHTHIKKE